MSLAIFLLKLLYYVEVFDRYGLFQNKLISVNESWMMRACRRLCYFSQKWGGNMVKFAISLTHVFMSYLFMKFVFRLTKHLEKTPQYLAKYWPDENGT